jgi:hypothetical protein
MVRFFYRALCIYLACAVGVLLKVIKLRRLPQNGRDNWKRLTGAERRLGVVTEGFSLLKLIVSSLKHTVCTLLSTHQDRMCHGMKNGLYDERDMK